MQTRTKFSQQLDGIQDLVVRLKEKCVADVRAAGLAATGDRGAQEGVANGRKAEDRLRQGIEDACLDAMLLGPLAHRRHDPRRRLPRRGGAREGLR